MNKIDKYTDDELIAYLMGEGDQETREVLSRAAGLNRELADRLTTLGNLRDQLRLLPVETFYRRRVPASPLSLLLRVAILTGVFFAGVLMQSELSILNGQAETPAIIQSSASGDFPAPSTIVM